MYLTSAMLLVISLTTSHQQELDNFMTSVEPSETTTFDWDTTLGVSPTEVLTLDYTTFDTTETSPSIFAYTDHTDTDSLGDTTDITSSIDNFTENIIRDLFTTTESDSYSTAPLVDTTSAPIDTTVTPTETTRPATYKTTTIVNNVTTTSTTDLFNSTNMTTAGVKNGDDINTQVIVGAVVGGVAGAGAAIAIALLAWRYRRRRDLNSNDEFTPGLKDGAVSSSSQRRPNTYILSMSSTVRSETVTSAVYANAAEVNELNTLRVTAANVNACPDNDAIYNNTQLSSSNENDDLYNNTPRASEKRTHDLSKYSGGPVRLNNDEMYNNTGGALDTTENEVLNNAGGSLNLENSDVYSNRGAAFEAEDDGVYERTDGPLGEESGVLLTINYRGFKAENDDVYVTTDIHSKVDNCGDTDAENEGLYEKPDGPRSLETEDFYESYDGAPIKKEDFIFSNDEVKPHQDAHNANETARLSTDSLYFNVPKELPPISLRDNATALIPGKSPGPVSPHSGYYKSPREVCGMMDGIQTEAGDPDVEGHEYVNIKSVKTLRDGDNAVAVDDVLASADDEYGSANDAGLDDVYINTDQAKR